MAVTAAEASESSKRRAVLGRKKKSVISKAKACEILSDGTVHGKKLTGPQRKFMAARCHA